VRSNDEIRPVIIDKALLQITSWLIRVRSCSYYSTYGIFRRVFPVFRVPWQQREGRKSLQVAELSTEKTVTLTLVLPALLSEQQAIPSTRLPYRRCTRRLLLES